MAKVTIDILANFDAFKRQIRIVQSIHFLMFFDEFPELDSILNLSRIDTIDEE